MAKKRKKSAVRKSPPDPTALSDKYGRTFPPTGGVIGAQAPSGATAYQDRLGRPYAIQDEASAIKMLAGLGSIMATSKECAAVLNVTEKTLFAFFDRCPAARDAWESGKESGKASLRRKQFNLADRNATMAIFLGMNYLEQKDFRSVSGQFDHRHQHTIIAVLLKEIDDENRGARLIAPLASLPETAA